MGLSKHMFGLCRLIQVTTLPELIQIYSWFALHQNSVVWQQCVKRLWIHTMYWIWLRKRYVNQRLQVGGIQGWQPKEVASDFIKEGQTPQIAMLTNKRRKGFWESNFVRYSLNISLSVSLSLFVDVRVHVRLQIFLFFFYSSSSSSNFIIIIFWVGPQWCVCVNVKISLFVDITPLIIVACSLAQSNTRLPSIKSTGFFDVYVFDFVQFQHY